MENKYSYNKWSMEGYGYLCRITKEGLTPFVAEFREEKDAQEYIDWKNQPKIDTEMKKIVIECINSKFRRYIHDDETYENYKDAIKIIENLPTGEN